MAQMCFEDMVVWGVCGVLGEDTDEVGEPMEPMGVPSGVRDPVGDCRGGECRVPPGDICEAPSGDI